MKTFPPCTIIDENGENQLTGCMAVGSKKLSPQRMKGGHSYLKVYIVGQIKPKLRVGFSLKCF